MGKDTAIEWAHATFNPWWGCEKVSPACAHCYAERDAKRYGHDIWGPDKPRRFLSDRHWREPEEWNRQAEQEGRPWRVFAGSMCDILEDRDDLQASRERLWGLVERTPNLIWLLLTKRPEKFPIGVPARWMTPGGWPRNAWAGTTTEDQPRADERIPHLLQVPAPVRFLSAEALLGPLEIEPYLWPTCLASREEHIREHDGGLWCDERQIDWVIAGGESGPHARPTHPRWVRRLRDQCTHSGTPFFFKQWGEWAGDHHASGVYGNPAPAHEFEDGTRVFKVGKRAAGRLLDGREWNELPEQAA